MHAATDPSRDLTADQVAARTERARGIAADAGRDLGLAVTDPVVLYDVFSVVVHLAPAPVVVRVPTVVPPTAGPPPDRTAAQRDELEVAGWLADQGVAVVRPSPLVPRRPVERDGYSMTFWEYVDRDDAAAPDTSGAAALTAELEAALRRFPRELPFLTAVDPTIADVRHVLAARPDLLDPADLDRAEREWAVLAPVLESAAALRAAFPGVEPQTIHGDSPPYNLIPTATGPLFADFELVTRGPVEWDLTFVGPEGERAYDDAAVRLGLPPLDTRLLRVMEAARMLQVVACMAMAPQLPMLADGLREALGTWRSLPFAGGLTA